MGWRRKQRGGGGGRISAAPARPCQRGRRWGWGRGGGDSTIDQAVGDGGWASEGGGDDVRRRHGLDKAAIEGSAWPQPARARGGGGGLGGGGASGWEVVLGGRR